MMLHNSFFCWYSSVMTFKNKPPSKCFVFLLQMSAFLNACSWKCTYCHSTKTPQDSSRTSQDAPQWFLENSGVQRKKRDIWQFLFSEEVKIYFWGEMFIASSGECASSSLTMSHAWGELSKLRKSCRLPRGGRALWETKSDHAYRYSRYDITWLSETVSKFSRPPLNK